MKFFQNLSILAVLGCGSVLAQGQVSYSLVARNQGSWVAWDNDTLRTFGFAFGLGNPPLPAPTLYSNEGDSVHVNLWNMSQGDPHTIHWHGLDVNQENDGVPHTSWVVDHGADSTYHFKTPIAGTYLYHCHVNSAWHVQMGMYGAFVVRAAGGVKTAWTGGPPFDKEYLWLFSEVDREWHDSVPPHDPTDSTHEHVLLPPYLPDYFLINGKSQTQLADTTVTVAAKAGEKVYLRLANVGYMMNEIIFPSHLQATVLDSDGRPYASGERTDTLRLTPGERYGVMLSPTQQGLFTAQVRYIDLNTGAVWATELPAIQIIGAIGVDEPTATTPFRVWPNPTSGNLRLRWEESNPSGSIGIWRDMAGRSLGNFPLGSLGMGDEISLAVDFPDGVYFLEIQTESGGFRKKILIQR